MRSRELTPYNQLPPVQQQNSACFPQISYVDVPLCLSGPSFDLNEVLKREGEAEQLAFKGWVEQVYNCIWDSQYRNVMRDRLEGSDIIPPEAGPIGDLRLIRNDLVHNGAVASAARTGRCTVLKWFRLGEDIVLGMRHVLDFLNQIGFMTTMPGFRDDGSNAAWTVFPGMENELINRVIPEIVSIRTALVRELDDGSTWHALCVVFENGVFANFPVSYPSDGTSIMERNEFFSRTSVDDGGNLRFANGTVSHRQTLYREAVSVLFNGGQQIEGMSVPGPWFRIRR